MHRINSGAAGVETVCKCVIEKTLAIERNYCSHFFLLFSMERNRGAPQVYGYQAGVAQWDAKPVNAPVYGRDVSLHEALDGANSFDYVLQSMGGINLQVSRRMAPSAADGHSSSASRVALLILNSPNTLFYYVTRSSRVLNLDCGFGFSGIAAHQLGYSNLVLTDVSAEHMRGVVWPNIVMNCSENVANVRCVVSSNWVALSEYLSDPGPNK